MNLQFLKERQRLQAHGFRLEICQRDYRGMNCNFRTVNVNNGASSYFANIGQVRQFIAMLEYVRAKGGKN